MIVGFAARGSTYGGYCTPRGSSNSSGCSRGLNQIKLSLLSPCGLIDNESMPHIGFSIVPIDLRVDLFSAVMFYSLCLLCIIDVSLV